MSADMDRMEKEAQERANFSAPQQGLGDTQTDHVARMEHEAVQRQSSLLASATLAIESNPDEIARQKRVAKLLGRPLAVVQALPEESNRTAKLRSIQQSTAESPVLRDLFSGGSFAAVAHDDVDNLSALEKTLGFLKGSGTALASAVPKFNEGAWGLARAGADLLPDAVGKPLAESFARMGGSQRDQAASMIPKTDNLLEASWYSGMQSLGMNLVQLPLGLGGKMAPVLTSMGLNTGGQAYGEARDKGVSVQQSLMYGASQGVIEAGTEMMGMPALFGMLKPGKFGAKAMEYLVKEQGGEQIATHLQDLNEWAVLHPEKTLNDYLSERPNAALQTALSTAFAGGGQVAVMKGAQILVNRGEQKVQQAEQTADALAQLDALAAASKVRGRDAETFEQFIQQATQDGPVQDVFISANALYQSGVAEKLAEVSPAVAEQIQAAVQTGGDVRIPVAEYATRIAGTELSAPLLDHLRTDPDGFSKAEAADFMQNKAAQLQQDMERALGEKGNNEAFKSSQETVKNAVLENLNTAGRFSAEKNEFDATLIAARTAVRAAQLGITPEALFQKQLLKVQAENVAGVQQYGQNESVGPFGPRFDQFKGNAQGAIAHLLEAKQGEAIGALHHPEIGDIDLVWGKEGDQDKGYKGGYGLAKIAAKHPEVLADLQGFIDGLELKEKDATWATLASKDGKAIVRLDWDGVAKHWLVSAYETRASAGKTSDTAGIGQAGDTALRSTGSNQSISDDIQKFYQERGQSSARGAFDPTSNTIALLKNADLSTFLHEGGHYFFENDIALASELVASQREGASLTEGEQQLVGDVSYLLRWHGIQGDIDAQLAQWHTMDFEEKRAYHERTAESFEAYLLEGKAPSIEMQRVFQTFRAWLLNVYKSLKSFIETHPEAGQLNDEVRGVFDRMLATTEQIQLAEQGRSMMPLFESAMQAGMTPEEFARYQALGIEATQTAIQELQARGLRDMQWLSNKRGREIKKLQKQAKELRAEQEMEARREIMRQPVYQAWQFLTGKLRADDKVESPSKPKSDPNIIDETQDSLFVAIAKLGGLNKDEVIAQWGTDPEDKPAAGVFGKPVWRAKDGGKSIDAMVEALGQHGYLPLDDHGKADVRDFEERFAAELRGDKVYADGYEYSAEQRPGEGATLDNTPRGKLDAASVLEVALPEAVAQRLRDLKMTAREGGVHPDIVAEMFGFSSGDEMVRKLAEAEKPSDAIEGLTDAKMLERYGDLATPEAIERAADAAIHNDARARFVATEANALAQATGQHKILSHAAREFAQTLIARIKVRDIRPSQYANAEARAAKAAEKASKAGDLSTAGAEKRNQVIQNYLSKAAHEARAEVESTVRGWKALANRSDKKLVKGYDLDIFNAIRSILGEYGIAEKQAKRAGEYLDKLKSYDPAMYAVIESSIQAAEANAKPYHDLTVEELRGLNAEIDAIQHLAKRSRQSEVDGNLLDRQDIAAELQIAMEARGVPEHVPGETSAVTDAERRKMGLQSVKAVLRRVEFWCDRMDGISKFGAFRRYVFTPVKEAADHYRVRKGVVLRQLRDALAPVRETFKRGLVSAPELNYTFGKDSGGVAMNEILHALLHTGNESNKRKLLLGRGWGAEMIDGHLDSSRFDAFVGRLIREGTLTKAHFDALQSVWDVLEGTKEGAQKAHRDAYGKYFDEVTANPFTVQFPDGSQVSYRGGYVPATPDSRIVKDNELKKLIEEGKDGMAFAFPSTPNGFTKSRVEYNRPLMLDLRTLGQHIDKVLLFSYLENPVRDVARLVSMPGVGDTLNKIDPAAINGMLIPWLNRSARQQVTTPVAGAAGLMKFLNTLRSHTGMALMFGNLSNAVQQIAGFSMAAVKVPTRHMLAATAEFVKDPRSMIESVREQSPSVAQRLDNQAESMMGEVTQILTNPTRYQSAQQWAQQHAYFLQTGIESVMVPIIWTAAYNDALETLPEADSEQRERDAKRLADAAIRQTQGSVLPEDVSRIEAGSAYARLFTQFMGYFNMQGNLLATETGKAVDAGDKARVASVIFSGLLVSAWAAEAIALAFKGGPDDEDKDGEYLDDWLMSVFVTGVGKNMAAMVPFAGSAVMASVNSWNGNPADDKMSLSPAVSAIESMGHAPVAIYKAVAEGGDARRAIREAATTLSVATGLPFYFAARSVGYAASVEQGKTQPTGAADAIRGFAVGSPSPQSKR